MARKLHPRHVLRVSGLVTFMTFMGLAASHVGCAPEAESEEETDALAAVAQPLTVESFGVNLAHGKPTSQSTTMGSAAGSRAVDGNPSGNFGEGSVTHTESQPGAWWSVDLGASELIGDVVIYNRTDCCGYRLRDFDVIVTDSDGTSETYPIDGVAPTRLVVPVNRHGQHVKIQLRGTDYLSLAEVQVFRARNLARGKPASQSSNYVWGGGAPGLAVDGNRNGLWGGASVTHTDTETSTNPWWQVDLGQVQRVGQVVLYNRTDCCWGRLHDFDVLGSVDGSTWITMATFDGVAPPRVSIPIPASITNLVNGARYVRVQLRSPGILSLAEAEVYAEKRDLRQSEPTYYHLCSKENGNLLEGGGALSIWPYTGLPRQSWQILPLGNGRFQLISRENGTFLTDSSVLFNWPVSHIIRLATISGTPQSNQSFQVLGTPQGYFRLLGPMFNDYLEGGGTVTLWPDTGLPRQYWRILPATPSREDAMASGLGFGVPVGETVDSPELTGFEAPPPESPEWLVGEVPLPYVGVKDTTSTHNAAWQVQNSPYYKLSRYGFWRRMFFYAWDPGDTHSESSDTTVGLTESHTDITETTLSISMTANASINYKAISAGVSTTISSELKVTSSSSTTKLTQVVRTTTLPGPGKPNRTAIVVWARGDRYRLRDMQGNVVGFWDVVDESVKNSRTYPPPPPRGDGGT